METKILNYKDYVISTKQGFKSGIFFRSPLQKIDREFMAWSEDDISYFNSLDNKFIRIIETIIGNGKIIKNMKDMIDNDYCGAVFNKLCSPIYFKRQCRELTAISQNDDNNIKEIVSCGYESEFETCSGGCVVEKTKFRLKNGKTITYKLKNAYNYTYEHIVKEILDEK